MGPMGGVPGTGGYGQPATAIQKPTTLLGEAKLAFSQGNNREGFQYLYAHYLCGDTGATDVQTHMKWSSAFKRHTVAVQFGIGVVYTAPRDYTGKPMAIGNDAENKAKNTGGEGGGRRRRGRPGGVGAGGGPMGPGGIAGPMPPGGIAGAGFPGAPGVGGAGGAGGGAAAGGTRSTLDYYTGELGESLLAKLEEKVDEGIFGDVQREMGMPTAAPASNAVAAGPMGIAGAGGIDGAGGPGEAGPGEEGAGGAPAGGNDRRAKDADAAAVRPGITFLGTASSKEALEKKAGEQGLDVLIVFDVKVQRPGKTGIVSNSTKISVSLVDRPQEIPLHTSITLTNVKVAAEREKDKDGDPVDDEIDKLMAKLEAFTNATGAPQTLKVSPFLEALSPQHAANRVTNLTASASEAPLRDLAEIKAYHSKKLISDQQFADAAKVFLKDKADLLTKGKEDERRQALASLLPKQIKR